MGNGLFRRGRACAAASVLGAALYVVPSIAQAQDFSVFDHNVQIHGFGSQAFAKTDGNNFLTMDTRDGSRSFSDAGVNVSSTITKRLRIGAQVYTRNIGNLGEGDITVDWAQGDYRFASWLGVRAGKVKTVMGLFNDTQDMEFLQTFALLPQSVYPLDLRDGTIAHVGADVYGRVDAKKAGALVYTAYVGRRRDTKNGGYPHMLRGAGIDFDTYGGRQIGGDVRWQTNSGLQFGVSHMVGDITGTGTATFALPGVAPVASPYEEHSNNDFTDQFYAQYAAGRVHAEAEHRRYYRDQQIFNGMGRVTTDLGAWYTAGGYRVADHLELGGYYSRSTVDAMSEFGAFPSSSSVGHVYDKVASARIDVTRFVTLKLEGHFMDGVGNVGMYPNGFYAQENANGFQPKTKLFITRVGFNF